MEFWGIEIKPGSPLTVEPEDGYIIHVSQVSLGELKKVKEDENVPVYVNVGDDKHKLIIGNLSQKFPQFSLDLFFEQEFELSHACKSSVFLLGYKTPDVMDNQDEEVDSDYDSEEEEIAMEYVNSVLRKSNPIERNDQNSELKPLVESDDEEEEESDSEMGSDEDEEEEPLKVEPPSKKRPNGGAMNNNTVASKKAKVAVQQKSSEGKKMQKCCKH